MEESVGQSNKAEAKNTQRGNKPFKKGEYTDMVLDNIGGENSIALHGTEGVVGDGEPLIVEESEPVPPNAETTFILDLSPVTKEQPGSPQSQELRQRVVKQPLQNINNDAYELLLKRDIERAKGKILLAEEQIKLDKLQQTRA